MTVTNPTWTVAVHPGDTLRISTTYDSSRASWYESMGIMVVWMANGASGGADPFTTKVDEPGHLTHGHLPENDHHGGKDATLPDVTALPTAPVTDPIHIASFFYGQGDMRTGGTLPSVKEGQPLTFINDDSPVGPGIWHSITACKAPCNLETGIAYPIADADIPFDSGQLGTARCAHHWSHRLVDTDEPASGHLHLLLSDPPVHARCVRRDPGLTSRSSADIVLHG